jgi:hypothetical protein
MQYRSDQRSRTGKIATGKIGAGAIKHLSISTLSVPAPSPQQRPRRVDDANRLDADRGDVHQQHDHDSFAERDSLVGSAKPLLRLAW